MGQRLTAFADDAGLASLDALDGRLYVIPEAVNIGSPLDVSALAQLIIDLGVVLVIVDTLARCTVGADENSSKDMGVMVACLDYWRSLGAAVLLVHHPGKDVTKGGRGSSAIHGAVDTELVLTRPSDTAPGRKLTNPKQKDAVEAEPIALTLKVVGASAVMEYVGPAPEFRPTYKMEQASLAVMATATGMTKTGIRKEVGGNTNATDTALAILVAEGHLTGGGKEPYRHVRQYVAARDPLSDTYTGPPVGPAANGLDTRTVAEVLG
jgi:hypothetical protein